jgi:hypothetical protein
MTARGLVVDTEAQTSIPGALAFIEAGLKDDFDLTPVTDPASAVAAPGC